MVNISLLNKINMYNFLSGLALDGCLGLEFYKQGDIGDETKKYLNEGKQFYQILNQYAIKLNQNPVGQAEAESILSPIKRKETLASLVGKTGEYFNFFEGIEIKLEIGELIDKTLIEEIQDNLEELGNLFDEAVDSFLEFQRAVYN